MGVKKFELNVKVLDNFDNVMSVKLDEIEELKVTSLDKGSKLLNIISLCANVKKLILEGDQRLNVDLIFTNMFKPEKLETLVLSGVKLPEKKSLKKFKNLKEILLNNIRVCNLKEFFEGIVAPKEIEKISISGTDMVNSSIDVLENFTNLKYLKLDNVKNCQFGKFETIIKNKKLEEVYIKNTVVPITSLKSMLKCLGKKDICVDIENVKDGNLKISEDTSVLTFLINEFKNILKEINLKYVKQLRIKVNKYVDMTEYINKLKYQKSEIQIILKDFSCLDVKTAEKIKNELKLENIKIAKQDYSIDEFIEERTELQKVIENVSNHVSSPEKFMAIYQYLGKEYAGNEDYNPSELCEVLQNSLKCVDIKSNIISGRELENDKKHVWNQVELEGKWYNVDLGLDIPNIKKNKAEYCLLGDKDFLESHVPKSGKNNYCGENFNQKIVNVFLKTGLFRDKLFGSYLEIISDKVRQLFRFNKKDEVLALPSGEEEEKRKK